MSAIVPLQIRPGAGAGAGPLSIRGSVPLLCVAVLCAMLTSCFVLRQDETFAIGTESNRLNLVVFVSPTKGLDAVRAQEGTRAARNLVLSQAPESLSLSRAPNCCWPA